MEEADEDQTLSESPTPGSPARRRRPQNDEPPSPTSPSRTRRVAPGEDGLAGNIVWTLLAGWWLAGLYLLAGLLCLCSPGHAKASIRLCGYFLWPYNKRLVLPDRIGSDQPGALQTVAVGWFRCVAGLLLVPAHCLAAAMGWGLVYFVPMARLNVAALGLLFADPVALELEPLLDPSQPPTSNAVPVLEQRQAGSFECFQIVVAGTNIVVLNLMPAVLGSLVLGYALSEELLNEHRVLLFGLSLAAVVPLCFTVGSLLTRMANRDASRVWQVIGLLLSCTVGRCVELLLYLRLMHHSLNDLVRDALVGALVALMLLLPAITLLTGGLRFREQRFNLEHAGLSSVMLVVSVIGGFIPTLFYEAYAKLEMFCEECTHMPERTDLSIGCGSCHYKSKQLFSEPLYADYTQPLAITCAILLPSSYLAGLVFTTKARNKRKSVDLSIRVQDVDSLSALLLEGVHGHKGWSFAECALGLVACLGLGYGVTDVLANATHNIFPNDVSTAGSRGDRLVGFVLLALVPNTLHFTNAIHFALRNRVGVSIEIASSAVVQLTLIQMPLLIFFSAFLSGITSQDDPFTMLFTSFHVFAVVFSMVILNYISLAGRVNYFEGVALLVVYLLWVAAFVFMPSKHINPHQANNH